jgi:hypothetical protein
VDPKVGEPLSPLPAASTPDRRVYVSLVVLAVVAWGTAFLAPNSLFWDDWLMNNGDTLRMYQELGAPWMGPIYVALFSIGPWTFKVLALASTIFVGCITYRIADRALGLNRGERWLLAALTIALPLNSARESVAALETYSLSLALFFGAWYLMVQKNPKDAGVARYVVAAVLLLASYSTASLLPFTLLPVGHLAYLTIRRGAPFWRQVLGFIGHYWYLFAAPVVFWVVRAKFFVPTGVYAGYNNFVSLRPPLSRTGLGVVVFALVLVAVVIVFFYWWLARRPSRRETRGLISAGVLAVIVGLIGLLMEVARSSTTAVSRVVPLAVVGCAVVLLVCLVAAAVRDRRTTDGPLGASARDRELTPILAIGLLALAVGVLPYLLVGKLPSWSVWDSRHQLLMPIGIGIIIVATMRALARLTTRRVAVIVSIAMTAVFAIASLGITLTLVADWHKQEQVIAALGHEPLVRDSSTIVFSDKASQLSYDDRVPNFYEYTGWLDTEFGNQRRLGVDRSQVQSYLSGALLGKVLSASRRYGFGEFRASKGGALVTIEETPGASWWGLVFDEKSVTLKVTHIPDLRALR